jgi:hypothetical protein
VSQRLGTPQGDVGKAQRASGHEATGTRRWPQVGSVGIRLRGARLRTVGEVESFTDQHGDTLGALVSQLIEPFTHLRREPNIDGVQKPLRHAFYSVGADWGSNRGLYSILDEEVYGFIDHPC